MNRLLLLMVSFFLLSTQAHAGINFGMSSSSIDYAEQAKLEREVPRVFESILERTEWCKAHMQAKYIPILRKRQLGWMGKAVEIGKKIVGSDFASLEEKRKALYKTMSEQEYTQFSYALVQAERFHAAQKLLTEQVGSVFTTRCEVIDEYPGNNGKRWFFNLLR